MSIFNLFKDDNSRKVEMLEEKVSALSKEISKLRGELKDTQHLVQYIANAHHGLATDMSSIYVNLQEVMKALTEPVAADPWDLGYDIEDPDPSGGSGGGWLN